MSAQVQAIDAEFESVVGLDAERLLQLQVATARPEHPCRKFAWGDRRSLWEHPRSAGAPPPPPPPPPPPARAPVCACARAHICAGAAAERKCARARVRACTVQQQQQQLSARAPVMEGKREEAGRFLL